MNRQSATGTVTCEYCGMRRPAGYKCEGCGAQLPDNTTTPHNALRYIETDQYWWSEYGRQQGPVRGTQGVDTNDIGVVWAICGVAIGVVAGVVALYLKFLGVL